MRTNENIQTNNIRQIIQSSAKWSKTRRLSAYAFYLCSVTSQHNDCQDQVENGKYCVQPEQVVSRSEKKTPRNIFL